MKPIISNLNGCFLELLCDCLVYSGFEKNNCYRLRVCIPLDTRILSSMKTLEDIAIVPHAGERGSFYLLASLS